MIEDRDTSGGKSKGQGTGNVLIVTLVDAETESSINATMLEVCALLTTSLYFQLAFWFSS